jgi:hypothetical protein
MKTQNKIILIIIFILLELYQNPLSVILKDPVGFAGSFTADVLIICIIFKIIDYFYNKIKIKGK